MATNGPIPMRLTVVDDGGSPIVSSTRTYSFNNCTKPNEGQSTSGSTPRDGLATPSNFVKFPVENIQKTLGILPSVVDKGTIVMVNSAQRQLKKTPVSRNAVVVPSQPPLSGVPRLNRLQAASTNTFLARNNALTAIQTSLQQNLAQEQKPSLPCKDKVFIYKGNVPNVTQRCQQTWQQPPSVVFTAVNEQSSRQQPVPQDAAGLLKNIVLKRVNGPVASPSNGPIAKQTWVGTQQSCVVVRRNSLVKPSNLSANSVPSTAKLDGYRPVHSVKTATPQLPAKTVGQPKMFYLVSGPNHPATLIPVSLPSQPTPRFIPDQNVTANVSHTRTEQVSYPQCPPPKKCSPNTAEVQIKRTYCEEQGAVQQPIKKSKTTNSHEVYIKKEPEEISEDGSSNMKKPTLIQDALPKYHTIVSNVPQNNQRNDVVGTSSGSGNSQHLTKCLTRPEPISVETEKPNPSWVTSHKVLTKDNPTTGTVAPSNSASFPAASGMSSFIFHTRDKPVSGNVTENRRQTTPMKIFIVTDKSGKARMLKVPASTPASDLLYTISNQCKENKLKVTTLSTKGSATSRENSKGNVVVVKKITVGIKQAGESSLTSEEKNSKRADNLRQDGSKAHETNNMGVDEGERGVQKSVKLPEPDSQCVNDLKQRVSKSKENNSNERATIVTRSKSRDSVPHKGRQGKSPFCVQRRVLRKRKTRSHDAKFQIVDHNYSFRPKPGKVISRDETKKKSKEMSDNTLIDLKNNKDLSKQSTDLEGGVPSEKMHSPEQKIKVTLPTVALKPLKLKPDDHFKTLFLLSESRDVEDKQAATTNGSRGIGRGSLEDSDQNGYDINFEGCSAVRKSPQKLSNLTTPIDEGNIPPTKRPETFTVPMGDNDLDPEISFKCGDKLSYIPDVTLEDQPEARMEVPSDLTLMSGKERIKILRERMRRREREIETLMKKSVTQVDGELV